MKKAGCWILLGIQAPIILGFWAWNHVHNPMGNLLTGDAAGQYLAWGRLAGLLAAYGILFQLILVGRAKWVEQVFGLDRLTRLHHYLGFSLIILLAAHPVLVTTGHALQAEVSRGEQFVDFCRNWKGVMAAAIAAGIMAIALLFSFIIVLTRRLRYEIWYAVHLTFYLAIAMAFFHQVSVGSDFTDNRWFRYYWYVLYLLTFVSLLLSRFVRPIWNLARHRFVVTRLVPEAGDVTSVHIEGRNMDTFPVQAGQFMLVRFLAPGFRWEAHPFSMSCVPDGKQIRLTIKQLGDFTRKIPALPIGTRVLIDGPHGVFTARHAGLADPSGPPRKVLMIAGGIGITPIRSLSEELIKYRHDVILLYAVRNRALLVFEKELEKLAGKSGGCLKVVPVLSSEPTWAGEKGYVDRERILRLAPDVLDREVFLCGPPPMMRIIRALLHSMGVPRSRIHYERFAL